MRNMHMGWFRMICTQWLQLSQFLPDWLGTWKNGFSMLLVDYVWSFRRKSQKIRPLGQKVFFAPQIWDSQKKNMSLYKYLVIYTCHNCIMLQVFYIFNEPHFKFTHHYSPLNPHNVAAGVSFALPYLSIGDSFRNCWTYIFGK